MSRGEAEDYRTDGAIENSKWDGGRDWTMPIRGDQVNDDGAAGDSDRECQSVWLATSACQALAILRQQEEVHQKEKAKKGKLNINRSTIYH